MHNKFIKIFLKNVIFTKFFKIILLILESFIYLFELKIFITLLILVAI